MAAIDPSEPAELNENSNQTTRPRATLKIIRQADGDDDEDNEEGFYGDGNDSQVSRGSSQGNYPNNYPTTLPLSPAVSNM